MTKISFEKYCLYDKHRKTQNSLYVLGGSLSKQIELFFIIYKIQLGNKKQKTLQEKKCRIKLCLDEIHL